ncbi:MAG: glycosyltransferase family 4 protein [Chloroflexota bacterium]
MKILMVSASYLPMIGGKEAHIFYLSRALQQMGHDVTVLTRVFGEGETIKVAVERGIRVYRVQSRAYRTPLWINPLATRRGIQQVIRDLGPLDILHLHDYWDSTLAVLSSAYQVKKICTCQSYTFSKHLNGHRLMHEMARWLHAKFDGMAAVSKILSQQFQALWGDKMTITYIPNGVDTDVFTPIGADNRAHYTIAADEFVVLCPTRMAEQKGVLYLAQAANLLIQQAPTVKWRFLFLGSDPAINTDSLYIEQVKTILSPLFERGQVSYLGNVPMAQMPALNWLADVVVMPSLWEGLSLSTLEAMACRKPLVVTDVGGQSEIVCDEKTGLLVPPKNPQALAEAILRLYQEPSLREQVALGGYELVKQHYSWERIAAQTADFYDKVLSG